MASSFDDRDSGALRRMIPTNPKMDSLSLVQSGIEDVFRFELGDALVRTLSEVFER